ncbi:hypothetical protein FRB90_003606 [Tulasnella sp. 427]|nr:hypothetical protein FRB90_003606 [Tulasnella sp. 427]
MNVPTAMASTSSQAPAKKQRRDDDKPPSGDKGAAGLVSLTRRRVWRACESCRRKKIKCDGTEPICGQCTQTNSNCTWIQTKDRAALSRQYVQELENRVMRLETVLTQVAPQVNLSDLPTESITLPPQQPQRQQVSPPQTFQGSGMPGQYPNATSYVNGTTPHNGINGIQGPLPPRTSSDLSPRTRVERSDTSDEFVAEQMGTLALDDHGHLRWIGGSSTMSLIEAFRNFSASEDRDAPSPPSTTGATPTPNPPSANLLYFPSSLRFGKVRALPGPEEVEYPPWDLAEKLVDAYFEKFHHTMPVLDSISFRKKYQRLMDARRQAEEKGETPVFGSSKSDAGFVSVVFAVYAVAARFVDDERLKTDEEGEVEETGGMGMVYYERAMILYYIGATATQLAHVQAFVLLSAFLASLNCLPQAWLLCGQAVRIAQDLGLHRSPKHLLMSPVNKETRRKVWWCVYGLDRMLAGTLGRPLGTEDSDCDVELPLPIDDVDLPAHFQTVVEMGASPSMRDLPEASIELSNKSLMAGFNALTELYVIVGKVLRTVYAVDAVEACKEAVERTQAHVAALDKELTDCFKRAVNEGEQPAEVIPEEPEAGPDEKQPRKIKSKPRSKSRPRRLSGSLSPPNEAVNTSAGEMDMDYLVHDLHEPQSPYRQGQALSSYSLSQQQSPPSMMKLAESSPVSTFNHGTPSVFGASGSVPHDWLPSPTVDSFNANMGSFNDIFSNVPPSLTSLSQPQSPLAAHRFSGKGSLSPQPGHTFDFSSTNLPFTGFDFLQGFSTGTGSANGGPADGFDAGNAAAWTDFVGTGVFNNVPDQPFNLTEHDHETILGMSSDREN